MSARIYVAYTGGTVGMRRTAGGYRTEPGLLQRLLDAMPELSSPEVPRYDVHEYAPLLDSSNMTPRDWVRIAEDIRDHDADYDGFVVLHGTDTMAYTASALSFMLEGLRKPVILTGAQIPLREVRNDARENLITALMLASDPGLPEVCLAFGSRILRGNRAVKVNADGFDAFASPNHPPLGAVGVDIEVRRHLVRPPPPPGAPLTVRPVGGARVAALRLFPGIQADVVANVLKPPLQGLVLECYGVGNAPDRDRDFLAAIEEATARGVVVVDVTQCLRGTTDLQKYATGSSLADVGVIGGRDMTPEAALTKLYYLLEQEPARPEMERLVRADLRGELTAPACGAP